jgi:hypothetical protein
MTRPPTSASSATATTASEARDDDVEEGCNSADNGLQDGGNAVNDGHEAGADGLAERFDLFVLLDLLEGEGQG